MSRVSYIEAKVPSGASQSQVIDIRSHEILGIEMPAAWDAAKISFLATVRNDGAAGTSLTETPQEVVDQAGTEVSLTVAQGTYVVFNRDTQALLQGLARVVIRSGVAALPVNQTADRIVRLILGQQLGG